MKRYGCIGKKLPHSFSGEIHGIIGKYPYELIELNDDEFDSFITQGNFKALNVTIPYKEKIIPFLYEMSPIAKSIGAVNTVVNHGGRLYGYNTDFFGMIKLIERSGVTIGGKSVIITGSGGTAKTAYAVAHDMKAEKIIRVSRTKKDGFVTYDKMYEDYTDAQVIINTTPVGMFPSVSDCPVDISCFDRLELVIDAVYNPVDTVLVTAAKNKGITALGGLYMLCAQAVGSYEIFTGEKAASGLIDDIYGKLLFEKRNIVLTGMPGCGKTTTGKILAQILHRNFVDTDEEIIKRTGMSIPLFFEKYGEEKFRDVESQVISDICGISSSVIATGGGAVERRENVNRLKLNGVIYFLDRPLSLIQASSDRPLAGDTRMLKQLYAKRYEIYKSTADRTVKADGITEHTVIEIERLHRFENTCD